MKELQAEKTEYYAVHQFDKWGSILEEGLLSPKNRGVANNFMYWRDRTLPESHQCYNNIFFHYYDGTLPVQIDGSNALIGRLTGNENVYSIRLRTNVFRKDSHENSDIYCQTTMTVEEYDRQIKEGKYPLGLRPGFVKPYYSYYSTEGEFGEGEILIRDKFPAEKIEAVYLSVTGPMSKYYFKKEGVDESIREDIYLKLENDLTPLAWKKSALPVAPRPTEDQEVFIGYSCLLDAKKYKANKPEVDDYLKKIPFSKESKFFPIKSTAARVREFLSTPAPTLRER